MSFFYKFFFFFATLLTASIAFAHGVQFLEFAPDDNENLLAAFVETPAQPFYAPNDFLGGFDVWLTNTGSSGTATFGIRDEANTLLASKTINIPTIPEKYGGTRFHVDLTNQIPISVAEKYRIRMVTSMPNLQLHYSTQFQILTHNAESLPIYAVEPGMLGEDDQGFAFKYALYETQETSPPVLGTTTVTALTLNSMEISFTANEPVDYRIVYGPQGSTPNQNTSYSGTYTVCVYAQDPCELVFPVNPDITYAYTLFAKDSWGNEANVNGVFNSPSSGGSPPPDNNNDDPPPPPPQENTQFLCSDGKDNDGDGLIDLADPNCAAFIPPPTNNDDPPPPPNSEDPPPPTGDNSNEPPSNNESGGSAGGSGEVNEDENTGGIIITWEAPEDTEGIMGYRIDIFDENNVLQKQLFVDEATRKVVLERLGNGKYLVKIYAIRNGVPELLGEPIPFTIGLQEAKNPFTKNRIIIVGGITLMTLIGLSFIIYEKRKPKHPQGPPTRSSSIFDTLNQ